MMTALVTALAASLMATLAVHMGLPEAVAGVFQRIASCAQCAAFWITLTALLSLGHPPLVAAALSLVGSYLAHWYSLLFIILQKIHSRLWQRLRKK
jgi:hypothetical protein